MSGHDAEHHVVYRCDGDEHRAVHAALRDMGVELVEAGPASQYARDIQVRQRWVDAEQVARAKTEVARLRGSIVIAIQEGSVASLSEVLKTAPRLDWDWLPPAPSMTEPDGMSSDAGVTNHPAHVSSSRNGPKP